MSLRDISPQLYQELDERANRTPDLDRLKYFENILVFVYGSLQRGHENYNIIADKGRYLGKGHTVLKAFSMYDTLNGFPMVFQEKQLEYQGHIHGEVWAVPPDVLAKIDRLENNGKYYNRQRTFVTLRDQVIPSKRDLHPVVDCQIYLGLKRLDVYHRMSRYYGSNNFYYQWYRGDAAHKRQLSYG